jgi:hypothetical protein
MSVTSDHGSPVAARHVIMLGHLVRSPILGPAGERIGRVEDVIVRLAEGGYPPVTGLKASIGERELFIGSELIERLAAGEVWLKGQTLNLGRFERRAGEVLLRSDVLGHHLVDVMAGRIIQAHDLAIAEVEGRWRLVGVDRTPRRRVRHAVNRAMRRPRAAEFVNPFETHRAGNY